MGAFICARKRACFFFCFRCAVSFFSLFAFSSVNAAALSSLLLFLGSSIPAMRLLAYKKKTKTFLLPVPRSAAASASAAASHDLADDGDDRGRRGRALVDASVVASAASASAGAPFASSSPSFVSSSVVAPRPLRAVVAPSSVPVETRSRRRCPLAMLLALLLPLLPTLQLLLLLLRRPQDDDVQVVPRLELGRPQRCLGDAPVVHEAEPRQPGAAAAAAAGPPLHPEPADAPHDVFPRGVRVDEHEIEVAARGDEVPGGRRRGAASIAPFFFLRLFAVVRRNRAFA